MNVIVLDAPTDRPGTGIGRFSAWLAWTGDRPVSLTSYRLWASPFCCKRHRQWRQLQVLALFYPTAKWHTHTSPLTHLLWLNSACITHNFTNSRRFRTHTKERAPLIYTSISVSSSLLVTSTKMRGLFHLNGQIHAKLCQNAHFGKYSVKHSQFWNIISWER